MLYRVGPLLLLADERPLHVNPQVRRTVLPTSTANKIEQIVLNNKELIIANLANCNKHKFEPKHLDCQKKSQNCQVQKSYKP